VTLLVLHQSDGSFENFPFTTDIQLGTSPENQVRLPEGLGVATHHAVISHSELCGGVAVLVDLAGQTAQTRINGRSVTQIKVLRHQDQILLGQVSLIFWEVDIQHVTAESPLTKQKCPFCFGTFQVDEDVIACPKIQCQTPHHLHCWLRLPRCGRDACGYPIPTAIRRIFASQLTFERLDAHHELVMQRQKCAAAGKVGEKLDRLSFQPQTEITHCPSCKSPFHIGCWFSLQRCPVCQYDVSDLIQTAFDTRNFGTSILARVAQ